MTTTFALPVPVETIMSDRLRIHPVEGDGMAPDLLGQRDYVILAPVDAYCGEGVYLIDWGMGPVLYRAYGCGGGKIRIKLDNPAFRDAGRDFTKDKFNEMCVGFVVAHLKICDSRKLREIMEGAR